MEGRGKIRKDSAMPAIQTITVEAVPGTEIRIRLVPPATASNTSTVEGMLAELVRRGGAAVQATADELRKMGYVPCVPEVRAGGPRQAYLGWSDPARPADARAKFTLYLEAGTVSFMRAPDRRIVGDLDGADTRPGRYVAFRLTAPNGVARALAAARAVKH
jgi:hypothetical protein